MKSKILLWGLVLIFLNGLVLAQLKENKKKEPKLLGERDTVYVMPNETVYHLENCKKLGIERTGMPLEDAVGRGYTPCPSCILKNIIRIWISIEKEATEIEGRKPGIELDKKWHEIASWEGTATKSTETFNPSTTEWRISWETKPGQLGEMNFQIYVYKANGDLVTVAANVIGYNKDSTIIRGAGSYYLTINTAQPYSISIQEKR